MDNIENNPPEGYENEELTIAAVGIVVCLESGEDSIVRIQTSDDLHYKVVGLFSDALDVAKGVGQFE